jgi:hypothetical protein
MNVLKEGIIQIHKEFFELKEGWDGYNAKPVDADVLESIRDMGFVSGILNIFQRLGFEEKDVEVVPTPNGTIQYEAQGKNIYLEIEIDAEYYSNYKKKEAKRYGQ